MFTFNFTSLYDSISCSWFDKYDLVFLVSCTNTHSTSDNVSTRFEKSLLRGFINWYAYRNRYLWQFHE